MSSLGQHIRLRLNDDRVIAPTATTRRMLARVVLTIGQRYRLLVFSVADTHLHLSSLCTSSEAKQFARRLEIALYHRLRLETRFAPAFVAPVRDAGHLYNTFHYILRQDRRHGLDSDPFREASNLPDLLGLRPLGCYTASNVRRSLPRIKMQDLLDHLGVPSLKPCIEINESLVCAGLMAAALPDLDGHSREVVRTRRAVVQVAWGRTPPAEIAHMLGIQRQSVYRLRKAKADESLVHAIRLQLNLLSQKKNTLSEGPFSSKPARDPGPLPAPLRCHQTPEG